MKPIFKYWGGKSFIVDWVISHFPENYEQLIYVEPFCGAANVLFKKNPQKFEKINDLDQHLMCIFTAVREHPSKLFNMLDNTLYGCNELNYAFDLLHSKKCKDYVKIAWAKFVLLEFSMFASGKRNSFTSNFKRQSAKFFRDKVCLKKFNKFKQRLKYVELLSRPATRIIELFDSPDTFFYLDPPYPETNNEGYKKGCKFTIDDFNKLTEQLKKIKGKYLLSFELKPGMECKNLDGRYLFTKKIPRHSKLGMNANSKTEYKDCFAVECLLTNYKVSKPKQLSLECI